MTLNQLKKKQLFYQKQLHVNQKKNKQTHTNFLVEKKKKKKNEIILTEKDLFVSQTYFVMSDTAYMLNLAAESKII